MSNIRQVLGLAFGINVKYYIGSALLKEPSTLRLTYGMWPPPHVLSFKNTIQIEIVPPQETTSWLQEEQSYNVGFTILAHGPVFTRCNQIIILQQRGWHWRRYTNHNTLVNQCWSNSLCRLLDLLHWASHIIHGLLYPVHAYYSSRISSVGYMNWCNSTEVICFLSDIICITYHCNISYIIWETFGRRFPFQIYQVNQRQTRLLIQYCMYYFHVSL